MLGISDSLSLTLQHYIVFSIIIFFSGVAAILISKDHKGLLPGVLISLHGLFLLASSFFLFTKANVFLIFLFPLLACVIFLLKQRAVYSGICLEVNFFQKLSTKFLIFLSSFLIFELLF